MKPETAIIPVWGAEAYAFYVRTEAPQSRFAALSDARWETEPRTRLQAAIERRMHRAFRDFRAAALNLPAAA